MVLSHTSKTALAIAVIVLAGVPLWQVVVRGDVALAPVPPVDLGPVAVRVQPVVAADRELFVEAFGTLQPARRTPLAVELAGRVDSVWEGWRRGAPAAAGQVLLRLDARPHELEAELAAAREREAAAGVQRAAVELDRATELLGVAREQLALAQREERRMLEIDADAVSDTQVDAAKRGRVTAELALEEARGAQAAAGAAIDSADAIEAGARAARAQAQDRLSRTVLRAPFAGRLAGRAPAVGSFLAPGQPLGELLDLSTMELVLQVPEERLDGLREGARGDVVLAAGDELRLAGTVTAIGARSDPWTRSIPVELRVSVPSEDPMRVAGLFARARIAAGVAPVAIVIERSHFQWRDGEALAFVLEDGRARERVLELGRPVGEGFLVRGGLASGDALITDPIDRLVEGRPCVAASKAP